MNRRQALKASGIVLATVVLDACSKISSPIAPEATGPVARTIPSSNPKYVFEVEVLRGTKVFDALTAAGLAPEAPTGNFRNTTTLQPFSGPLLKKVGGREDARWRIDIGQFGNGNLIWRPFCADVMSQLVSTTDHIGCFIDDGSKVTGGCFG